MAVVGSGPAGLAAAQQLARAGHKVTVFERAEMPGGLLRFGIPEFKMEKAVLERRLSQLAAEGVEFRCGVSVGLRNLSPPRMPSPVRRFRAAEAAEAPAAQAVQAVQAVQAARSPGSNAASAPLAPKA